MKTVRGFGDTVALIVVVSTVPDPVAVSWIQWETDSTCSITALCVAASSTTVSVDRLCRIRRQSSVHFYTNCVAIVIKRGTVPRQQRSCVAVSVRRFTGIQCKRASNFRDTVSIFSAIDSGVEWSVINAATLMTSGPLLIAFLLFQRQFVQSFMRAGIK